MARPKKSQTDRLGRVITFRLPEATYLRLKHQADLCGMSVNQLARRLTGARQTKLIIRTHRRLDPAFLKRIERIGHNLNQLVKNAHIFDRVSPKVDDLCALIRSLIEEAIDDERDLR